MTTTIGGDHRATTGGAHILVIPYPAQGHTIPLANLSHQLAIRNLSITILTTPKNLPLLSPLLSLHPTSIKTLVLPFPPHPSIPPGIENVKDLPGFSFRPVMLALGGLYDPIRQWFESSSHQPWPRPVAILSDMFLGWTNKLACDLGIKRILFSPSGAFALSIINSLWREMPTKRKEEDENEVFSFPDVPGCPEYPWRQLSLIYQTYKEGDPVSEFIKEGMMANIASWGLVINSFTQLEGVYLNHQRSSLGHDRVWAVGPLMPPASDQALDGLSATSIDNVMSWLDARPPDGKVVYVCFGSQVVLTNKQMMALALGLEKSNVHFIWSVKEPTKTQFNIHDYGRIPQGFEDRVSARGLIIRGWAPQLAILNHRAVGAFFTHCGWNSVLEGIMAGVVMLTWPMGADQYSNATLLVDKLGIGVRVCEGGGRVPDSNELARVLMGSVSEDRVDERTKAVEMSKAGVESAGESGSSFLDLDRFVTELCAL